MHYRTCWGVAANPRTKLWCLTAPVMLSRNACMTYVDNSIDAMNTCNDLVMFATRRLGRPDILVNREKAHA